MDPTGLSEAQRKWHRMHSGLMAPSGLALQHPAACMLLEFAIDGCPTVTGDNWTPDMLEAALKKGAHPSALVPEAATQLRSETLEKVEQGFARLVLWDDVKEDPPAKLKISPIAAVPHKSRGFRMILDLSYGVTVDGTKMPSVNEATDRSAAPSQSMAELGMVLPRLIYAVGTAPLARGPILFSKLDIKDGYWRMVVSAEDEWNFAYVLPKADPSEPTQLVIPSALQMGWSESPAFFCAASETARDVAENMMAEPCGSLPTHVLEPFMLPSDHFPETTTTQDNLDPDSEATEKFVRLLEVYIDDFINLAQTTDVNELRHISRAVLHGIHSIFPPPAVTGHDGEDPVALQKLMQGDGIWDVRKEILGWVFDGVRRCIELPQAKVESLLAELHTTSRLNRVSYKALERLRGRLRHACIGIPAGRGLMGPIDKSLTGTTGYVDVRGNGMLREALRDFHTLIGVFGKQPTFCRELIPNRPDYIGYCDASGLGAGGVWLSGARGLPPIVWRLEWPQDIRDRLVSFANPTGDISNSDLEMAGLLAHYLVLEHLVDLQFTHVAAWSDNTPTVSWANKLSSSKSMVASRLVRALALRLRANRASPLITLSISGPENVMADVASRCFGKHSAKGITFTVPDDDFLLMFDDRFPLPQDASWQAFRLSNKLATLIFSELRGKTSTLGSWLRITMRGSDIGTIGHDSSNRSITWTPSLRMSPPSNESPSWGPSLDGSGKVISPVTSVQYAAPRFKSRYVPSERRSNWVDNPTRRTEPKDGTGEQLNAS